MNKIVQLNVENVKRIEAVEITPDGELVVIGGKHGNGKSSVLDSIMYALGGEKALPPVPLRNGTSKGHITINLGDLVVTRKFTRKKDGEIGTSLEIKRANGDKVSSPQALLDSLCGQLAFDPLEFSRMKPKDQLQQLKHLVGLNFDELDRERAAHFQHRTDINRQNKAKQSEIDATPEVAGTPAAEVSVADCLAAVRTAEATNKSNADARKLLTMKESLVGTKAAEVQRIKLLLDAAVRDSQAAVEQAAAQREIVEKLPQDVDLAPLNEALGEVENVNRRVRQNAKRAELLKQAAGLSSQSDFLTEQIGKIDSKKEELLKAAKFPVDGLSFGTDGVLLNGLPLEQACTADRIRLSVAMGFALNPKLKVILVREGSLLFNDETGLQLIAEMAREAGAQVWVERVSLGEECSVIIEDGNVKAMELAAV
jgi:predicted ATP-dependent endonuclease of OLD family